MFAFIIQFCVNYTPAWLFFFFFFCSFRSSLNINSGIPAVLRMWGDRRCRLLCSSCSWAEMMVVGERRSLTEFNPGTATAATVEAQGGRMWDLCGGWMGNINSCLVVRDWNIVIIFCWINNWLLPGTEINQWKSFGRQVSELVKFRLTLFWRSCHKFCQSLYLLSLGKLLHYHWDRNPSVTLMLQIK